MKKILNKYSDAIWPLGIGIVVLSMCAFNNWPLEGIIFGGLWILIALLIRIFGKFN